MQNTFSSPRPVDAGQILLLSQAQQIASLTEQLKTLTTMLATAGRGGSPREPHNPEKRRLRHLSISSYSSEAYLPGKNHMPTSATAEVVADTVKKLRACFERDVLLSEATDGLVTRFRNWLSVEVAGGRLAAPTANKFLRQLRAICLYAAGKKLIKRLSKVDFLEESEPDFDAWTVEELAAIEERAKLLDGMVGPVPAAVFWTAWTLVFRSLGSRVTATMLCRREDFFANGQANLLLRRENQKQKKDQRIALPPRAAVAVQRLLDAHNHELIFGVWPYDPPVKSNGRRKWKVLAKHFEQQLVKPAGLTLPKGVKTRQFRRTAATVVEENGGNAQELLGHGSRKTTERYLSRKRRPICRQSLCIPDASPQKTLF